MGLWIPSPLQVVLFHPRRDLPLDISHRKNSLRWVTLPTSKVKTKTKIKSEITTIIKTIDYQIPQSPTSQNTLKNTQFLTVMFLISPSTWALLLSLSYICLPLINPSHTSFNGRTWKFFFCNGSQWTWKLILKVWAWFLILASRPIRPSPWLSRAD